ncbi:hypothetical protein [Clostridium sp.]|jgi:hypothetical protein|uniref:YobI family P-loop NTPase n=1 Tax=Clostridium sp. TaxID=1506 RepID=UPI00258CCBFC|nr:hypothetical protein [Clostridium sp.]MDF2503036.1 hypothetical protein [Clostridium sp.]
MSEESYNFQKLTPINDAELSIYKNALDFIFENSDIKNVGISGAYSAGKSSVVETYKKMRSDVKFMHISLAYFKSASEKDRQPAEQSENVLEGKILNQLIHQINPSSIPQTNFRVKRQLSFKKLRLSTAIVSFVAFLLIYLLNWGNWNAFVPSVTPAFLRNILLPTTSPIAAILAGLICIAIFAYLIYEAFKMQLNKNLFKGISVQGNTIEIFEQSEESYFDKYLNEVLYLFENSDKDVIVFEDMDRYNTNQIFQRLREINTLINSKKKPEDKPLRFFYLLRDDIFINKERTKFFDFILPVVPIVDGSNSFDQFIDHFKKGNIYHLFNEHFLQEISLYIDDMRILKNIYNEFLIYYKRISTTEQDPNKLLAMILYKNIFPRDFSELQLSSGFVHTLFSKKEEFIKDEIARLNDEIAQINGAIVAAENEHLKSVEEVNEIYNPKIQDLQRYYNRQSQIDALNKEKNARLDNLKNRDEKPKNALKQRILELESLISELQHKKLQEIINKQNAAKIFKITFTNEIGVESNFNDIKGSDYFPLVKYLIRYGYIDETYPDYMTYFYEHSLSRVDKIFLRSVTDEEAKDYNYQLKSPSMVLARLSACSFEKEEILNFDLLSYLLDNGIEESKTIKMLLQLKANKNFKFIDLYFASGKPIANFIKTLNSVWPTSFEAILDESTFTEERKKQYALESLYYTNDEILEKVNSEGILSTFVSSHKDFLNIENPNIQRLVSVFELNRVKFEDIDYTTSNRALFQAVYQHSFYIISFGLICLMLKEIYDCCDDADLKHKNYTMVLSKPNEPLVKYVQENINDYVEEILRHCDDKIFDSEDTAIKLLNTAELNVALKENYINKLTTSIQRLQDISEVVLWPELLGCNLLVYSENNVLQYFFHSGNGLDELIANFINEKETSTNFDYDAINSDFGKDAGSKFFFAVVKSEDLSVTKYAKILKSLHRQCTSFNIENISDQKMDVIITQKIATMIPEVLVFIRENYPKKTISFIKHNIEVYVEKVISEEMFDFDELIDILDINVADKYKLQLLQHTDKPISAMSELYSPEVKAHILQHNFSNDDLPKLLRMFSSQAESIQTIIIGLTISNVYEVIENEYLVPMSLCRKIFVTTTLDMDIKFQILAVATKDLNEAEFKECLRLLNQPKLLSTFDGKRPAIAITSTNEKLLDAMVNKHWIVSYDIDKKDETMYRVSSRRIFKQYSLSTELL